MDGPWTTRKLLAWTTQHFEARGVDSPRVAAEMLLGHVLGVPRLRLYMEPDRPAGEQEREVFRGLVARAGKHEPVDYLVGKAPFFALEFKVSPAVLIPRPSTETLVEHVLQRTRSQKPTSDARGLCIADVCTGSGAVALSLLKNLPTATAVATDLSEEALAVAKENAEALGVADRVEFRRGDLLEPLGDERFDYLLSNPPYISDAEWAEVAPNVRDYEPTLALRSGADGLDHLRRLINDARRCLLPGAQVLLEMAASQEAAVLALARAAEGLTDPHVLKDHEGLPRVLVADAQT